MEVLSIIISVIGLIVHLIQKADNSSNSGSTSSYTDVTYQVVPEFTVEEKLENMNIDSLNICYQTAGIANFSIQTARRTLLNHFVEDDFYIEDIIIRQNCMYIKVLHSIPFNGGNKCYGASFSINFMTVNNGVSVYGAKKLSADETQVFKEISNELLKAVA